MNLERQLGLLAGTLHHPVEAIGREWSAAFRHEKRPMIYFVGAEQGATSLISGKYVHESVQVHDQTRFAQVSLTAPLTSASSAAADKARRGASHLSFWLTAALLFGAFAASLTAAEGGALRDGTWNNRVLTPRAI
jgi:hypothetical protein